MSAKIYKPDFEHNGYSIIDKRRPVTFAREYVAAHPPRSMLFKLLAAWFWVAVCCVGDFGLMIDVQKNSSQFTDARGNFSGDMFQLYALALLTLAIFVFMSHCWQRGGMVWRGLSALAFTVLTLWIVLNIKDTFAPRIESLWTANANPFTVAETAQDAAPQWLVFVGLILFALAYQVFGWLFLLAKSNLADVLAIRRNLAECKGRIAADDLEKSIIQRREAVALQKAHIASNTAQQVRSAVAAAISAAQAELAKQKEAAARVVSDICSTEENQINAGKKIAAVESGLSGLSSLALSALLVVGAGGMVAPSPASAAVSSAEILQAAPVVLVLVDVSPNPAIDPVFLRQVWPKLESKIRAAPLGSEIVIQSIGNAAIQPLVFRSRIYARKAPDGDTIDNVVKGGAALLAAFPERFKDNHRRSEIVGALAMAARDVNPSSNQNQVIVLSDGWENSDYATCRKADSCALKLPAPDFKLNASVSMYGVGGAADSKSTDALFRQWQKFFAAAGAKADLHGK
jgi:hypothetical protein